MPLPDHAKTIRHALTDARAVVERLGLTNGPSSMRRQPRGVTIRCPWHDEHTPSCSVRLADDGTIAVNCFGCGKTGDVLTLIAHARGFDLTRDFRDVLRAGAELAGLWSVITELEAPRTSSRSFSSSTARPATAARAPAPSPPMPQLAYVATEPTVPGLADRAEFYEGMNADASVHIDSFHRIASALLERCPLAQQDDACAYLRERKMLDLAEQAGWGALPADEAAQGEIVAELVTAFGAQTVLRSGLVFARRGGLTIPWSGNRLLIPYRIPAACGAIYTLQRRLLRAPEGREQKYVFPRDGGAVYPYAVAKDLDELEELGEDTAVIFCEGAPDVLALRWLAQRDGIDALVLGLPGVKNWHSRWAALARGRTAVLALDVDRAGEETLEQASELEENILAWDARFARYLEGLGEAGKRAAAAVRQNAARRLAEGTFLWQLWADPNTAPAGTRFAQALARVLWADVVEPRLRKLASLAYPIHVDVTRLHSRTFRVEERDGQRVLAFRNDAVRLERTEPLNVPTFEVAAIDGMLASGLDRLGSVTAHKLLRYEVTEGHRQVLAGIQDPRALCIEGGWSGLAERLALPSKARDDLHAIVIAQAHCAFALPGGAYGNLLSYMVWPARGQRRGQVKIILGDALLPHFVFAIRQKLGESRAAYEAQRLVPIVDLPPFLGRPNEHGAQATLSMAMVAEMRAQAVDMVREGGALFDGFALATRSGLKPGAVPAILDRWTQDGTDAPAFLKRVARDRFTLGDAHVAARAFIEQAGRDSIAASEAGKRSAEQRARQRSRKK